MTSFCDYRKSIVINYNNVVSLNDSYIIALAKLINNAIESRGTLLVLDRDCDPSSDITAIFIVTFSLAGSQ